ncbi:hypothetical protein J3R82DRAFT_3712 [Butyriboletus roseoflavus]|nr:hypothetical protein J3R82DRAFT_3712 [Butyriboletus roseoflavus]
MLISTLLEAVLLLLIFLTIESARVALWATRAVYEPDPDGGLLRALFALVIGVLGAVPTPVWTVVMYASYVALVPVRGVLWIWGIGRGTSVKKRKSGMD